MLVELPDAASILTGLFIFLIGFIAIITYFKVKLYVNSKKIHKDPAQLERLEYYERQLIDLKIRLDTIDLENVPKSEIKSKKASIEPTNTEQVEKNEESQTTSTQIVPISRYSDVIDAILHTITDKSMTSRDIQINRKNKRTYITTHFIHARNGRVWPSFLQPTQIFMYKSIQHL